MRDQSDLVKRLMQFYRISMGDKELADQLLLDFANDLNRDGRLSLLDTWLVAGHFRGLVVKNYSIQFFTLGKQPDPRPNASEKFRVWSLVQELMIAGKSRGEAIGEVAITAAFGVDTFT
jgi:hypothetical protein